MRLQRCSFVRGAKNVSKRVCRGMIHGRLVCWVFVCLCATRENMCHNNVTAHRPTMCIHAHRWPVHCWPVCSHTLLTMGHTHVCLPQTHTHTRVHTPMATSMTMPSIHTCENCIARLTYMEVQFSLQFPRLLECAGIRRFGLGVDEKLAGVVKSAL